MEPAKGTVIAVCTSARKGTVKQDCGEALVVEGKGVEGDAHAGPGERQISLLALEAIETMKSLGVDVGPGSFGENLTIAGLAIASLPLGTRLKVGREVLLQITVIGKVCHRPCSIYYRAGTCIMPKEGVFAAVLAGGRVARGDDVTVVP